MKSYSLFARALDLVFGRFNRWAKTFNPYIPEDLKKDGLEPVRIEESQVKQQAGKVVIVTFLIFLEAIFNKTKRERFIKHRTRNR